MSIITNIMAQKMKPYLTDGDVEYYRINDKYSMELKHNKNRFMFETTIIWRNTKKQIGGNEAWRRGIPSPNHDFHDKGEAERFIETYINLTKQRGIFS